MPGPIEKRASPSCARTQLQVDTNILNLRETQEPKGVLRWWWSCRAVFVCAGNVVLRCCLNEVSRAAVDSSELDCFTLLLARHLAGVSCYMISEAIRDVEQTSEPISFISRTCNNSQCTLHRCLNGSCSTVKSPEMDMFMQVSMVIWIIVYKYPWKRLLVWSIMVRYIIWGPESYSPLPLCILE